MTPSPPTIDSNKKPSVFYGFVAWVAIVELVIGLGVYFSSNP